MSAMLDYLAEDDTLVVFDIDGVLAVYEFGLSHSACPDEQWQDYIAEHDPYATMRPVRQLQRFIELKDPSRVYACSVAAPYEADCKRAFVKRNYAIPEDQVLIVENKQGKFDALRGLQEASGLPQRKIALVEDTVKTLNMVYEQSDFTTVHVSSFFDYGL